MVVYFNQQACSLQVFDDFSAGIESIKAVILSRSIFCNRAIGVHDALQWQVVPLSHVVIVEVVCWGDLNATGAEAWVEIVIGNNGYDAIAQRKRNG